MISGLIGARGFHALYENLDYYLKYPIDIFKLWQGGFVFYGGFFGALIGAIIFLRMRKESFWSWADFMAPILAFGYGVGRIGCLLNGCCFGRECMLPWAIEFSHTGLPAGLRHPTQIYATLWELCAVVILLFLERRRKIRPASLQTGKLFLLWLFLHSTGRLIMEYFRDDFRGEIYFGFSISSWISIMILVSIVAIFFSLIKAEGLHKSA